MQWLREEARRRFDEGPFPALPGIFQVTEEGVDPVAEAELPVSDES